MKKKKKILLLVVMFFSSFSLLYAQTDTSFWFVAPEVSYASSYDRPIYLHISSYSQPAVISISQPANPSFGVITQSISANQTFTVNLSAKIDSVENKPPNKVLNRGIHISSSAPVSIYYEVATNPNTDLFVLKGKHALGKEFYIPSQNKMANRSGYSPEAFSAFDIVATENNTVVSITPKKNVIAHTAGTTFNVTLNKGQTYSATATSQSAAGHLIGSKVTATKPIAITVKDDLVESGACADLQGDQIVPVNVIGSDYIVVKGSLSFSDGVYIVAAYNNTSVYLNGSGTAITTINAGDYYVYDLSAPVVNIHASNPVYVYHNTGTGCEIGGALLPGLCGTGANSVQLVRTTNGPMYINIVTTNAAKSGFLVNGNPGVINASAFSPVPGSTSLVYAFINISGSIIVGNPNQISNTLGSFHLGVINGGATGTSYGYFSGYSAMNFNLGPDKTICQGFPATLDAGVASTSYLWSTGDTTRSIQVSAAGSYWVRTIQFYCTVYDTINVNSYPQPDARFTLATDSIQCFNQNLFKFTNKSTISSGNMTYFWRLGDNGTSTATDAQHSYSGSGGFTVKLIATSDKGCIDTFYRMVFVTQQPKADFGINDSIQCENSNKFIFNNVSDSIGVNFKWILSNGYTSNSYHLAYSFAKTGKYTVKLIASVGASCIDSLQKTVEVLPGPKADFSVADTLQCLTNNSFVCTNLSDTGGGVGYRWYFSDNSSSGNYNSVHSFVKDGSYQIKLILTSKVNSCQDSMVKNVRVIKSPATRFTISDSVQCEDVNHFLFFNKSDTSLSNVSFLWDFGDGSTSAATNPDHYYNSAGFYSIKLVVSAGLGCTDSVTKTVQVLTNSLADFSFDTVDCSGKVNFTNLSTGATDFLWDFGDGKTSIDVNPLHTYDLKGIYPVTLVSSRKKGCFDTIKKGVEVTSSENRMFVPNVFSPNNDLNNDVFKVMGWDYNCEKYRLIIYNRWGQELYDSDQFPGEVPSWNGYYQNKRVASGVYIYLILGKNLSKYGSVTVIY
jgi:gliding motility-associated-like protein